LIFSSRNGILTAHKKMKDRKGEQKDGTF